MPINTQAKLWVVIPAAGMGRRMTDERPKQYLPLMERTVIEWSLAPFLARADITGVMVALANDDRRWDTLSISQDARIRTTAGGTERNDSVLRSLEALAPEADVSDWVLVDDAARPCLAAEDLERLIDVLINDGVGGILATPVTDTLKRAGADANIEATVSRHNLWRALTPQMFRYGVLHRALLNAAKSRVAVTDESSAVEALGMKSRLVTGRRDNFKVTLPEDLQLAEYVLRSRVQASV